MRKILGIISVCMVCCCICAAKPERGSYNFIVPDSGSFTEAVNAANLRPDKTQRYRIFIRAGKHLSKGDGTPMKVTADGKEITVPSPITTLTAPNTSICGEGMELSLIESVPEYEGIGITSTLFVKGADSTYIQGMELWSNFNADPKAFANRSVALRERSCRGNILTDVSLKSNQDTYYTNGDGTTYLERCKVQGTVDFICGGGTVYFNRCDIVVRARGGKGDVICAPSTETGRPYGYVFNRCRILGAEEQDNRFLLGRPWHNEPRAVFLHTEMLLTPHPGGWTEMHGTLPRLFAEYGSTDSNGKPIDTGKRRTHYRNRDGEETAAAHPATLTPEEATQYTTDDVFPGWHPERSTAQVMPPAVRKSGRTLSWDDIPEAFLYAVCRNGIVTAFTTEPHYRIPRTDAKDSRYTVRCANRYGGLGPHSDDVY